MMNNEIMDEIRSDVGKHDIVLYMKGTKDAPQCGFSGAVVSILKTVGVGFKDVDVLKDIKLREAVKEYAKWPTIPQLYVRGEFIGGCDIVREMYQSGELQKLLKDKGIVG